MSPKNQQDYSELPLPYERHRFFFVFSQDMCALSSSHPWPMLSMSAPWGWKNSWLFEKRCLGGYRSETLWFFTKRWSKDIGILWNFEIYLFFRLSSGIETFLCGLILNDCVASGSLQQRTWRWDKRPMHLFDGITLALKQWMVWMRPFGTLVSDTSLVHLS